MFKAYNQKIKKIVSEKEPKTDWKKILNQHQTMIQRIQHERLIHLLVTIFVGLIMSVASFITLLTKDVVFLIFVVPLFFLFIAYLFHYRFLENTTQSWYEIEDKIKVF